MLNCSRSEIGNMNSTCVLFQCVNLWQVLIFLQVKWNADLFNPILKDMLYLDSKQWNSQECCQTRQTLLQGLPPWFNHKAKSSTHYANLTFNVSQLTKSGICTELEINFFIVWNLWNKTSNSKCNYLRILTNYVEKVHSFPFFFQTI